MLFLESRGYILHSGLKFSQKMFLPISAFEPGSLALAAYVLHSTMKSGPKKKNSCKRVKYFLKRHKHGLLDVALDEMADPTLYFMNSHTHDLLSRLPQSYALLLYFLVLVITILA